MLSLTIGKTERKGTPTKRMSQGKHTSQFRLGAMKLIEHERFSVER